MIDWILPLQSDLPQCEKCKYARNHRLRIERPHKGYPIFYHIPEEGSYRSYFNLLDNDLPELCGHFTPICFCSMKKVPKSVFLKCVDSVHSMSYSHAVLLGSQAVSHIIGKHVSAPSEKVSAGRWVVYQEKAYLFLPSIPVLDDYETREDKISMMNRLHLYFLRAKASYKDWRDWNE